MKNFIALCMPRALLSFSLRTSKLPRSLLFFVLLPLQHLKRLLDRAPTEALKADLEKELDTSTSTDYSEIKAWWVTVVFNYANVLFLHNHHNNNERTKRVHKKPLATNCKALLFVF